MDRDLGLVPVVYRLGSDPRMPYAIECMVLNTLPHVGWVRRVADMV